MLLLRHDYILLAGLAQHPLVIPIQPSEVILLDDEGPLKLTQFNLGLLQPTFVAALLLITLFLYLVAVKEQRIQRRTHQASTRRQ